MSQTDRAVIEAIQRELRELRDRTRLIPARWAATEAAPYVLIVGSGNTLTTIGATAYKGLKYPSADVEEVPSAAPASITTTSPDGISPAHLVTSAGTILVWIGTRLKPGDAVITEMAGSFYEGTPVLCRSVVSMSVSGPSSTRASVYVPFRI